MFYIRSDDHYRWSMILGKESTLDKKSSCANKGIMRLCWCNIIMVTKKNKSFSTATYIYSIYFFFFTFRVVGKMLMSEFLVPDSARKFFQFFLFSCAVDVAVFFFVIAIVVVYDISRSISGMEYVVDNDTLIMLQSIGVVSNGQIYLSFEGSCALRVALLLFSSIVFSQYYHHHCHLLIYIIRCS